MTGSGRNPISFKVSMEVLLKEGLKQKNDTFSDVTSYVIFLFLLAGLYLTSLYSYLLFHSLAELFSIVVAFSLFVIAWNSKKYIRNQYLLFIGIAYLFIGLLDLLHTLSYKGMAIFPDYDFYANQLWIGARYLESLSLLFAFVYLYTRKNVRPYLLLGIYTVITALLVCSIFVWKIFPECFIEELGLTSFKKNSEYVICAILSLNIFLLYKNQNRFEKIIYLLLLAALICTIVSELAFTFYVSNYGLSNLVGHYFKLFSFILVYQAIVKTCIEDPYRLIFRELDNTNGKLRMEVETRKRAEAELTKALSDVKKLSGLLPICASCKNIRDDQGYWRQIESFIREHSEADFSHGICPDCVRKMYPEIADDILTKGRAEDERQRPKVVASRNYFNRIYGKEWSRCARENKPLSLIIISFPGLLKCGESLIRGVEDILNKNLKRPYDYLAGYEEEAYAIILPYTDDRGIRQVADSILNDYVGHRSQNRDTCLSGVSIHLAMVTTVPDYDGEPQAILAVVEENLRGVKGKGLDQISQTSI